MNQGAYAHRVAVLVILFMAVVLGIGWAASAAEDVDILQVVQSFQRLASLDPAAAGSVWMTDEAAEDWSDFVRRTTTDGTDAMALFGHGYRLTSIHSDGIPFGGLYNPWVASLIAFSLDERATTITGFALFVAEDQPIDSPDAQTFAGELMARIERVDAQLSGIAQTDLAADSASWTQISSKLDEYVETLRWIYGASLDGSTGQANVHASIDRLAAESFDGALSLLRREDEDWLDSLFPVWAVAGSTGTFVAFSSTEQPLDLVSMRVAAGGSSDPIRSVSVIRLFDRLTTRGGEGS